MLAEADARRWHEHSGAVEARARQAEALAAEASAREAVLGAQVRGLEAHLADAESRLADARLREATLVERGEELASLLTEAHEARVAVIAQLEATFWWRAARQARLVKSRLTGGQ